MKVAWKVALVIVLLTMVALVADVCYDAIGHGEALLEVTVRVVDRDTGEPLAGAVVATVCSRGDLDLDNFDGYLRQAVRFSQEREYSWREYGNVTCATRTASKPATIFRSKVFVSNSRFVTPFGSVETSKTVRIPELLLIDHPRHGRTIIPIDPETPVEEGDEPNTWRLDLGTVRVPE